MAKTHQKPHPGHKADENYSSILVGTTENTALKPSNEGFLVKGNCPGVNTGVDLNIRRKRFMRYKKPFKEPKIMRCKSGDWYIEYFFEYPDKPGIYKSFKVRDGINYIKDLHQKEIAAKQLLNDIAFALNKEFYNPFAARVNVENQITNKEAEADKLLNSCWSLSHAVTKYRSYLHDQNVKADTIRTYEGYLRNFERWVNSNNLNKSPASGFTEIDLERYLKFNFDLGKWSARTYNNYSAFFITFFAQCQSLERKIDRKITYDCRANEIKQKIARPQKNASYTPIVANQIKGILDKPGNENLRDYIEWIYLSLMRPLEIINLRISDIDETVRQIRIMGKTDDRLIPISDQLLSLIEKRGLSNLDHTWYVFGTGGKPGPVMAARDYFSDLYTAKVKGPLKLGVNFGPYSWKPTGIIKMIHAGFKDEEIMVLSGHKTVQAFAAYKRDLVVDNSHVMKGKAVDF